LPSPQQRYVPLDRELGEAAICQGNGAHGGKRNPKLASHSRTLRLALTIDGLFNKATGTAEKSPPPYSTFRHDFIGLYW
jgi:hypothetical protein